MVHGVSPLLIEILAGINQQDTPLLLSLRTPEITITRSDGMDVDKCRQKMAETTVKQCIMNLSVEIREMVMKG
ncbi:hypothetical protein JJL53_22115 [Aeromonas media]|uniref:hypothetical protein n=1 Tax=Aeromonas media TaxID=651 RepID=UPI001913B9DB|nr:hypothetical protein [Aeromonas media]QQQ13487.1 hypothetical protein JJL53_22115 [Aeromonas media]